VSPVDALLAWIFSLMSLSLVGALWRCSVSGFALDEVSSRSRRYARRRPSEHSSVGVQGLLRRAFRACDESAVRTHLRGEIWRHRARDEIVCCTSIGERWFLQQTTQVTFAFLKGELTVSRSLKNS
jgi:hypothetical protein